MKKSQHSDNFLGTNIGLSKVICRKKWDAPVVHLSTGQLQVCCKVPAHKPSLQEISQLGKNVILNSQHEKERRYDMLTGIAHSDCSKCLLAEKVQLPSKRTGTPLFPVGAIPVEQISREQALDTSTNSNVTSSEQVRTLDLMLGNSCDLKCIYCSPNCSSQWASDLLKRGKLSLEQYNELVPKSTDEFSNAFWEWFYDVGRHSVKLISILGGEPTYMKSFYPLLDKIVGAYKDLRRPPGEDVRIAIVTNLNTPIDRFEIFLEKINKLTQTICVQVEPSAESMNRRAEYIRENLNWNNFESNLMRLLNFRKDKEISHSRLSVNFQMANNCISLSSLPTFLKWIQELNQQFETSIGVTRSIVSYPQHLNLNILTPDFVKYLDEAEAVVCQLEQKARSQPIYHSKTDWTSYRSEFLNALKNSINRDKRYEFESIQRKTFKDFITKKDHISTTKFLDIFPEYKFFLETCKE